MDLEQQADNLATQSGGGIQWTSAMSSFMLTYLSQLVASGTKTSTGFKQVHLNGCARALNENLGVHVTGTQVSNHLRKWKKVYGKIQKLKNLSGALWDEENCIISLDRDHYIGHIRDHREDANYLNSPIEYYHEMATIFGNSLATGAYARGANDNDPLGTEMMSQTTHASKGTEDASPPNEHGGTGHDELTTSANNCGESSGTKPPPAKKAKVSVEDPNIAMMTMISQNLGNLADAITKVAKAVTSDGDIPEGLYEAIMSVPGFPIGHLDHYYAYLCEHPPLARAFYRLSLTSKMVWVSKYIKEHLPDADL